MTGAEILRLQAPTGPVIDLAYRDEFVERFALDPSKPAPTPARSERQTWYRSPDHRFASVTGGLRTLDGERLIA